MNEWRCSECGCTVEKALKRRARAGAPRFTARSTTCSAHCQAAREVRFARLRWTGDAADQARRMRRSAREKARRARMARLAAQPDGEVYRLALNLRTLREDALLTVREVAARARISPGYIQQVEGARRLPSEAVLRQIAAVFGTTARRLCGRSK